MAYGRNGRHITIKKGDPSLGKSFEKRLQTGMPDISANNRDLSSEKTSGNTHFADFNFLSKLRILPAVIVLAFVVIFLRVPNLFDQSGGDWRASKVVGSVKAQEKKDSSTKTKSTAKTKKKTGRNKNASSKDKEKPLDPVLFTRSEIELLQELSRRRKELDQREQAVVQREGLLMAAETRLEARINELETVKSDIETLITKYDAQEEEKFKGLVAIYEKMKPKESARIFNELDIGILLEVFERMKASKSASILAKMRPEIAKEITSRIADRREMPSLN